MRLKNEQNLEFNVPGGKLNRGMSVVDSVKILRGRALSDDECTLKPRSWGAGTSPRPKPTPP